MARKVLFQTALTDLETTDVEGLGVEREDEAGNVYRWVKNSCGTALIAAGCCLMDFVTTAADVHKRVRNSDVPQTGPATCMITMPAGSPITGIAKSGAGTGDHGWIQVAGIKQVSMRPSATDVQQAAGCLAIATAICVTNDEWGKPFTSVHGSATDTLHFVRGVQLVASLATTGVATVLSAIVQIKCL